MFTPQSLVVTSSKSTSRLDPRAHQADAARDVRLDAAIGDVRRELEVRHHRRRIGVSDNRVVAEKIRSMPEIELQAGDASHEAERSPNPPRLLFVSPLNDTLTNGVNVTSARAGAGSAQAAATMEAQRIFRIVNISLGSFDLSGYGAQECKACAAGLETGGSARVTAVASRWPAGAHLWAIAFHALAQKFRRAHPSATPAPD